MYFEDDEDRTFVPDVRKQKDRTIIYGDGWKQYIAKNSFIGGECIDFSMEGAVNRLRTLHFSNNHDEIDEDDDQDHEDSQDDQDDGSNQNDVDIHEDEDQPE